MGYGVRGVPGEYEEVVAFAEGHVTEKVIGAGSKGGVKGGVKRQKERGIVGGDERHVGRVRT